MNSFVFIDNKYIGTRDHRISDTRLDISFFTPTRSQWIDLGFRLDISKKSGIFLLALSDEDLDTWAYQYIPKAFRWMNPAMGDHFDCDIKVGESPNDCEIVEKYSYCYIDPNSEEWEEFIKNSNTPKAGDEPRTYKLLVAFEDFDGNG